jgi:hypothetical protein
MAHKKAKGQQAEKLFLGSLRASRAFKNLSNFVPPLENSTTHIAILSNQQIHKATTDQLTIPLNKLPCSVSNCIC